MQAALTKDYHIIKNWLVNLTDFPYYQKMYEITIKQIDTYKIEKNKEQSDYFARKKQLLSLKSNLNSRKILLDNLYQELVKESLDDQIKYWTECFFKHQDDQMLSLLIAGRIKQLREKENV